VNALRLLYACSCGYGSFAAPMGIHTLRLGRQINVCFRRGMRFCIASGRALQGRAGDNDRLVCGAVKRARTADPGPGKSDIGWKGKKEL